MATKSILKDIVIKDKKMTSSLVNALESAKGKHAKDVIFSRAIRNADADLINKVFGDKNNGRNR